MANNNGKSLGNTMRNGNVEEQDVEPDTPNDDAPSEQASPQSIGETPERFKEDEKRIVEKIRARENDQSAPTSSENGSAAKQQSASNPDAPATGNGAAQSAGNGTPNGNGAGNPNTGPDDGAFDVHGVQILHMDQAYHKAKRQKRRQKVVKGVAQFPVDVTRKRVDDLRQMRRSRPDPISEDELDPFKTNQNEQGVDFLKSRQQHPLAWKYITQDGGVVMDGPKGATIKDDSVQARKVAMASVAKRGWDKVCIQGGPREYQEKVRDMLRKQGVAAYLWEDLLQDPEGTMEAAIAATQSPDEQADHQPAAASGSSRPAEEDQAPEAEQGPRPH